MDLYNYVAFKTSRLVTQTYSTSFSIAVGLLPKTKREAVYSIYGFVRFADEIVDTFHSTDQKKLLDAFQNDFNTALSDGISMNPVLHAFALTVKAYAIPPRLIEAFMASMRSDLDKSVYTTSDELNQYIYGSADVVGLMCLMVFLDGDEARFDALKESAMSLGSAFQKVNFLRDLKEDRVQLGRSYFPEMVNGVFDTNRKVHIEQSIEADFNHAFTGIVQLPGRAKLAVAIAYYYYRSLFDAIKHSSPERLLSERIRISDLKKYTIFLKVLLQYQCKWI
jgi:phytoene/squalene synthetase